MGGRIPEVPPMDPFQSAVQWVWWSLHTKKQGYGIALFHSGRQQKKCILQGIVIDDVVCSPKTTVCRSFYTPRIFLLKITQKDLGTKKKCLITMFSQTGVVFISSMDLTSDCVLQRVPWLIEKSNTKARIWVSFSCNMRWK